MFLELVFSDSFTMEFAYNLLTSIVQLYNSVFQTMEFSSDDEDEEMIDLSLKLLSKRITKERKTPSRIKLFMEQTIANCSQREFQSHFRITVQAFDRLLEILTPQLNNMNTVIGRPTIQPRKQLLAVLWLLATPDSYRSVANRFDMGKASLYACFKRVIKALNQIAPQVIIWPRGDEVRRVEQEFYNMAKLRGVIGAIDGTYVEIKAPQFNPEVYINRKCFYGITLQAVCDSRRKFTDCYTGWPSSVSDSRIFKNSDIYRLNANPNNYFEDGQFIIGDKAYPLNNWCIPPYINRGNLRPYQLNFNKVHAQTRQIIERAFALLFGRFRRLRYLDMNKLDLMPVTIIACCVLHNICLNHSDELLQVYEEEGREFVIGNDEEQGNLNGNNIHVNRCGMIFRDQLARNLINNRI